MKQPIDISMFQVSYGTLVQQDAAGICVRNEGEGARIAISAANGMGPGGVDWHKARYFVCDVVIEGDRTAMLSIDSFASYNEDKRWPDVNFGISLLPGYPTRMCLPLSALKSGSLHVPRTPGRLTMYVHGKPLAIDDLVEFSIGIPSYAEPMGMTVSNVYLADEEPEYLYPPVKLVDEMGQWTQKDWPERMPDTDTLNAYLRGLLDEAKAYDFSPAPGYSKYGGWKKKQFEATGYFRTQKEGERWWLVDPEGYAFISAGPDCVGSDRACYVKGMEHTLAWLPDAEDEKWKACHYLGDGNRVDASSFDYAAANLIRAYGDSWFEDWALTVKMRLHQLGFNTIANWSDRRLYKQMDMPYVYPLKDFPGTDSFIHRDFPDVFSPQYAQNAKAFAEQLHMFDGDRNLIGYFMRNEPTWAFTETLLIAEEMLANPEPFVSKDVFIAEMQKKYGSIEAFNAAWNLQLADFEDLKKPMARLSAASAAAKADLHEFSIRMTQLYVQIPAEACKAVDPHHLNLGMRWAFIHNLDLLAGSEYLDVFSMNRYAETPADAIDGFMTRLNMPLLIGEYHFGALDKGMTSPGHQQLEDQAGRGLAYRYYTETAIAKPVCVGTHYFTYNDQGPIGRNDGENFQQGVVDCCQQVYKDFAAGIRATNDVIYQVAAGEIPPTPVRAKFLTPTKRKTTF